LAPNGNSIADVPKLAAEVIEEARDKEKAAAKISKHHGYIGSTAPNVLLVGDKRNDKTVTSLPFMPINGNSGEFLLSCLPDPFWKNIGIVNGEDIQGKPFEQLWVSLGCPKMIALGRMAEKYIKQSGFSEETYSVVPHPQYVRRFHHSDKLEYGKAIARIPQTVARQEDKWILR
jgi:hypothetical protein